MNSRSCYAFILSAVCATGLNAGSASQIENLAPWSVQGVAKETLVASDGLDLPANAQLFRDAASAGIRLSLVSSPVFASTTADLPVVEIGNAAVAFLREGANGRLVLVLGDNPPFTLPWIINLDENGRSAGALALTMAREGASIAITTEGQTLQFPAGPDAGRREIVLSAGASRPWSIQVLATEIEVVSEVAPNSTDLGRVRTPSTLPAGDLIAGASASRALSAIGGKATPTAEAKSDVSQISSANPPLTALEIFTPPAVRHGRAVKVRAVIGRAQSGEGRMLP